MGIFSALAIVFFVITFATTQERVQPDPTAAERPSSRTSRTSRSNGPWIAMFVLTIFLFITLAMRGGVMLYYFKYYVGREDLFSLFNVFGLGRHDHRRDRCRRRWRSGIGKRDVFIAGLRADRRVHGRCSSCCRARRSRRSFALEMLRQLAYGFTIPLLWAMMADVADYSEWKNRRRATADRVLGDRLRPQGGTRLRRRDRRLGARRVRLRAERGADGARAAGHPAHGEHLPGDRRS